MDENLLCSAFSHNVDYNSRLQTHTNMHTHTHTLTRVCIYIEYEPVHVLSTYNKDIQCGSRVELKPTSLYIYIRERRYTCMCVYMYICMLCSNREPSPVPEQDIIARVWYRGGAHWDLPLPRKSSPHTKSSPMWSSACNCMLLYAALHLGTLLLV